MGHFLRDFRLTLRTLAKRRTLTLLLALTLGLGLGANIAMFGMFDVLLIRPFDFPNVARLVRLWEISPTTEMYDRSNTSPANFLDWKGQTDGLFESLVALEDWDANVRGEGAPERVPAARVSKEFFEALGVSPSLGRGFLGTEAESQAAERVVVGHGLWQRAFGGRADVVGTEALIDGKSFTIVGVAPRGFGFPEGAEVWSPIAFDAGTARRDQRYLTVVGLLRSGRTLDEARTTMDLVAQRLATAHPETNKDFRVRAVPFSRGFEDVALRSIMGFFIAGTGLVLLIACVNLGNFLLAQGAERRREIALRQALGASRARIVGQLVTEGVVIALLSLGIALPVAAGANALIRDFMPLELVRYVPGWSAIGVDERAAGFGFLLALASAAIFALAPARSSTRTALTESLKEGGRSATAGSTRQHGRNILVTSQIATALAIVIVGSLSSRSARAFIDGPQGYEPAGVLGGRLSLPAAGYATPQSRVAFARSLEQRLALLPGVQSAAVANVLPARGANASRSVRIEGAEPIPRAQRPTADARSVGSAYFETMRIPILAGRALDANDMRAEAEAVAVVSRSFAERYWPGLDPIGRRFQAGDADDAPYLRVVGVSGDVIHQWFGRRNHPTFYRPFAQDPRGDFAVALRTSNGDPEILSPEVRRAVAAVDPGQPVFELWSMKRSLQIGTIGIRFVAAVMTALSGLALILALSGVYGVMAYRVSLRTLEFGIRRALGASAGDVLRLTLDQAARLTLVGLTLGAALGIAMGHALGSLLQGAMALDAATVGGAAFLIGVASFLAAYVPAKRAVSVEPTRALRAE